MAEDIELDDYVADILGEDADEEVADEETSFSFQPIDTEQAGGGDRITPLRRENLRSAIDDYYNKLAKQEGEPQGSIMRLAIAT